MWNRNEFDSRFIKGAQNWRESRWKDRILSTSGQASETPIDGEWGW
jgi:hypothetical protein